MNYGWIITKDLLAEEDDGDSAVGVIGPRDCSPALQKRLRDGEGVLFRMLDDDGEVYYKGLLIHPDVHGFEPLYDFGMPDSGCTDIQFRHTFSNGGREWRSL